MFLLCRPVEVREDGFTTTHTPFMIDYDGRSVYAAFVTVEIAMYFVRAVQLDKAYVASPLSEADPTKLKDSDHAFVFRSESQVDRMLTGRITGSGFGRSLVRVR